MNARHAYTDVPHTERTDLKNLVRILPFITAYRGRASLALACLVASKVAIVAVPLVLKQLIDYLTESGSYPHIVPIVLLSAYGLLRFASSLFNELRDVLFARVRYRVMHLLSVKVLEHLHRLSLRFHLERKTGNITRDLERGTQSISSILNYLIFNIIPTLVEFALVTLILISQYQTVYFLVAMAAVCLYIGFTLVVANWRMHFRHLMNRLDSDASGRAVDSLLNYETVKYFDNEDAERDSQGDLAHVLDLGKE